MWFDYFEIVLECSWCSSENVDFLNGILVRLIVWKFWVGKVVDRSKTKLVLSLGHV